MGLLGFSLVLRGCLGPRVLFYGFFWAFLYIFFVYFEMYCTIFDI